MHLYVSGSCDQVQFKPALRYNCHYCNNPSPHCRERGRATAGNPSIHVICCRKNCQLKKTGDIPRNTGQWPTLLREYHVLQLDEGYCSVIVVQISN